MQHSFRLLPLIISTISITLVSSTLGPSDAKYASEKLFAVCMIVCNKTLIKTFLILQKVDVNEPVSESVFDRDLVLPDVRAHDIIREHKSYGQDGKGKRNFNGTVLAYVTPVWLL